MAIKIQIQPLLYSIASFKMFSILTKHCEYYRMLREAESIYWRLISIPSVCIFISNISRILLAGLLLMLLNYFFNHCCLHLTWFLQQPVWPGLMQLLGRQGRGTSWCKDTAMHREARTALPAMWSDCIAVWEGNPTAERGPTR